MNGYHFLRLDKNGQIYRHGWNFNMADIEFISNRRVFWYTILLKYHGTTRASQTMQNLLGIDRVINLPDLHLMSNPYYTAYIVLYRKV